MKKKYRSLLIVLGIICIIIGSFYIFRDKPLVCTRITKLSNGVSIKDKYTIQYQNKEVSFIKINKSIDLDEHIDISNLDILKRELENKYNSLLDKKIYAENNVLYMDAIIKEGKFDINGFNIELKKNVLYVVDINKSYNINIGDIIEKVEKTFNNLDFVCE